VLFPAPPRILKSMDSVNFSADQVVKFYGMELRLAAVTELIRSHGENTFFQLGICARYYKEHALKELFPTRRSLQHLTPEQRKSVYGRAIEMAEDDAANGISLPLRW
jgi:hypothetical protein